MVRRSVLVIALVACGSAPPPSTSVVPAGGSAAIATPAPRPTGLVLDRSFGDDGHASYDQGRAEAQFHDVIVAPDGAIYAAGHGPHPDLQMTVVKFTESGELDPTFGTGGAAKLGTQGAFGRSLALDGLGRLLVVGYFHAPNGERENVLLARVQPNGTLDGSFGTGGLVTFDLTRSDDRPASVTVLPSGQILVVGIHSVTGGYETYVARLDDTGAFDPTFGTKGVAYFDPVPGTEYTTRAIVDPVDGSVVISGYRDAGAVGGYVARLGADGKPDRAFGQGGVAVLDALRVSSAWAQAIDPRTRAIYFGGQLANDRAFLVKLAPDGTLDRTWGKAGVAMVSSIAGDQFYALLPHPDGSVIGVGFRGLASGARPMLARFTARGRLDAAFGERGVLLGPLDGDFLFGATRDTQGRIVVVGMSSPSDRIDGIGGLAMRFVPRR